MDCDASNQLVSTPTCTVQTNYPASSSIHQTSDLVAAAAPLHLAVAKIDQLPNELKNQIVEYLEPDVESIKNIRLASRSWAFLGAPYLLSPTFTALPHRDDFTRLVEVAQHPYFSQQIKTLNIRWMSIDEEELRLHLIAPYGGFTYDEESFRTSWGQYRKMKGLIDLYADAFCNEQRLNQAFKGLTQISELDINPDCYLFPVMPANTYLQDAFRAIKLQTHKKKDPRSRENFRNILSALTDTKLPRLRTLSCNHPPVVVWQACLMVHKFLEPTIRDLSCLKAYIGGTGSLDVVDCHEGVGVGTYLSNAKELRELRLTGALGSTLLPAPASPHADIVFPHLHTVALGGNDWLLSSIQQFLYDHRSTLRRVRLEAYNQLQSPNWSHRIKSLLGMMKNKMHIQQLDYREFPGSRRGTQLAVEMLERVDDGLWDDNWNQAEGRKTGLALVVENYVLRNGPCPDWNINY